MATSVEIAGFLRSVSTAIEIGKRMLEVAQRSGNTELYNAIIELNRELVDVKLSSVNQTSQIVDLKQEITQLKERNLDAARQEAQDTLLDQRLFRLNEQQWEAFTKALDAPPSVNPALTEILAAPAPWE
jgi:uncharacterized protein (DUF1778 family)